MKETRLSIDEALGGVCATTVTCELWGSTATLLAWVNRVADAYCLSRWSLTGEALFTAPPPVLVTVGVIALVGVIEVPTEPVEASATFKSRIRWRVASRI